MKVLARPHASTPVSQAGPARGRGRQVFALALPWALVLLAAIVATGEPAAPESRPSQVESTEAVAVMPLGA